MGASNDQRMTSGKLATRYRVSPNSIKNWSDQWETDGTMPKVPRTPGGHRVYGPEHVAVFDSVLAPSNPKPAPQDGSGG